MPSREILFTEGARVVRFGLVGITNTAIYTGSFLVFLALGLPYVLASILAYVIAISIAYFLNHRFTFRAGQHSRRLVAQFFVVQGLGAVVNIAVLAGLVEGLEWSPTVAQLVIIPPVITTTFVANRLIVFRAHVDTRLS